MKILIADDTEENLFAAKRAAKQFPENEFFFTGSATQAANMLTSFDAVVTDFIFEEVPEKDIQIFHELTYVNQIKEGPTFEELVISYYQGKRHSARTRLNEGIEFAKTGTVTKALQAVSAVLRSQNWEQEASEAEERIGKMPLQFPLGGGLMVLAKRIGMKHCLVSDIHRHAGQFNTPSSSIDGVILLLPLIEAGIVTIRQAINDGNKSLTYMGGDQIRKFGKMKTNPDVWVEALSRIMAQ